MRPGYFRIQIWLHWLIALLVPTQYLTGGSIERTHHAVHMGMTPDRWDLVQHHLHNYLGIGIGVLMGLRLVVRLLWPPLPDGRPASAAQALSRALHHAFYAAIIGQAAIGLVASYIWFGIAPYHVIGSRIILAMVALHVAAAAWHTLVLRDETIDRMVIARRPPSIDNAEDGQREGDKHEKKERQQRFAQPRQQREISSRPRSLPDTGVS
ncbi:cytochrome b/b6 domain-containing protein [Rhizobium sp. Pop5]|uniref:cytochrome b n=1 Tax=Rhizobium sp. Pop5 TaxID=1223565 RepID=UPI000FFC002A|nr:cytochrome b/b6 domain-containing protein [Rhizobium sp. Pop5]UVD59238.1 cytochrome b/b6 domain-containing protein [Rhizobium sp. Pop5]